MVSSFLILDLPAISKLLEAENCGRVCAGCNKPFDKGKKRKVTDACGHVRCYSCLIQSEKCPLCATMRPHDMVERVCDPGKLNDLSEVEDSSNSEVMYTHDEV